MKKASGWFGPLMLLATPILLTGAAASGAPERPAQGVAAVSPAGVERSDPIPVSGGAVHYFTTSIVHSQEPTATGRIQRSTEIIELTGDLSGYVLYHPTSVIDTATATLVNTGTQLFSGTVAGSGPVLLHDDEFRFDVDLATGETVGKVHLGRSEDAPHPGYWYECTLDIVGTGTTPEGDAMADYTGVCTRYGDAS